MKAEVGDTFIILGRSPKCKNQNKRFVITKIIYDRVYYDDLRTNNNCGCKICYLYKHSWVPRENLGGEFIKERDTNKNVSLSSIKIVETRLQRLRDIRLKLIL